MLVVWRICSASCTEGSFLPCMMAKLISVAPLRRPLRLPAAPEYAVAGDCAQVNRGRLHAPSTRMCQGRRAAAGILEQGACCLKLRGSGYPCRPEKPLCGASHSRGGHTKKRSASGTLTGNKAKRKNRTLLQLSSSAARNRRVEARVSDVCLEFAVDSTRRKTGPLRRVCRRRGGRLLLVVPQATLTHRQDGNWE